LLLIFCSLLIIVQLFIYHWVMMIGNQLIDLVLDWLACQDLLLQLRIQVILRRKLILPKLKLRIVMMVAAVIISRSDSVAH
jgi:hypothetical protein